MENMDLTKYTIWRNDTLTAKMETDKKYLILKMGNHLISTAGLGWYVLYTLRGIRFAVENHYVPVVDWQNCKLPQYSAEKVGKENVWEYFFEQPCNVNVKSAYASNDFFVLDDVGDFDYQKRLDAEKFVDFYDSDTVEWRKYFQKYIRIKKNMKECFEQFSREYIQNNSSAMIGVLARGTDYAELRPTGHLKPILLNEIFEHIDRVTGKDTIFLATEDENILRTFEEMYPGRVLSADTKRYKNSGKNVLNHIYKDEDGYKRDVNYLYSLYMISQCPTGIYSACGGSILASLMRKEEGRYYRYLCHGQNQARGLIVGSYLEKAREEIIMMGDKPIMFYVLNLLKLLSVEATDIIISEKLKLKYEEIIGCGERFCIRINYIVSDDYKIVKCLASNSEIMETAKTVVLYADYFVHGKDIVREMAEQVHTFDGACAWGVNHYFSDNSASIKLDNKQDVPQEAEMFYRKGNYSLIGRYVFDYELKDIVRQLIEIKKQPELTDILNEYISRKKIFFLEYKRGVIYSKIKDKDTLDKLSQVIRLLEDIQAQKIGDFQSFEVRENMKQV